MRITQKRPALSWSDRANDGYGAVVCSSTPQRVLNDATLPSANSTFRKFCGLGGLGG
jgi:hypothetical protein